MKFVIEAIGLTAGGGKEGALNLMARLAQHTQHQFTLMIPNLDSYKAISGSNIRKIIITGSSGLLRRGLLLNYEIPRVCHKEKADALLCLGNFSPWVRVCPTAVFLHNPWIVYGDAEAASRCTAREKLINAYGRHSYRHLPKDVTVIAQTQVMKEHLCEMYGVDPKRVVVIPNTFSFDEWRKDGNLPSPARREGSKPFTFLCLARYYTHKNIEVLPDALEKLPRYTNKQAIVILTIAPQHHPGARRLLAKLESWDHHGLVTNLGPVPSQKLPDVYRSADAMILPTFLESFSRTYLEATYFGLPILTSDRDFAHHLCQDSAIYFDPLDADDVARAMARVMEDADLRESLVAHGQRLLAQAPTWEDITARFVEVMVRTARGQLPVSEEPDLLPIEDQTRIT